MSETIRTILAVAVLTAAIWVWADLEQTGDGEEQVPVRVTAPQDYECTVSPDKVTVRFKGPRGEIQSLAASPEDLECRLTLTEQELKGSRVVLHARDGFRHWAARRIIAVDAKGEHDGAVDGDVIVRVDRLIRVRVRVEPKVAPAVAVAATAQPPEVTARVSESRWKALPEAKRFAVAPLVVSSVPENSRVDREVSLERKLGGADGIDATFDPPIVKVTARLESALVTKSLSRYPILISGPPEVLNRYRVVFQPEAERFVDLEVQGPKPDIEALNVQDVKVLLILTPDDKPDPASWLPGKPVVVGLPPTVKLVKPLPTVNFNLEKPNEKPPTP